MVGVDHDKNKILELTMSWVGEAVVLQIRVEAADRTTYSYESSRRFFRLVGSMLQRIVS